MGLNIIKCPYCGTEGFFDPDVEDEFFCPMCGYEEQTKIYIPQLKTFSLQFKIPLFVNGKNHCTQFMYGVKKCTKKGG